MTQIVPADARLSRTRAGQPIGYTVLTLQRGEFRSFTNSNVVETLPGCFAVQGGASAPDAGGYIVWGLADEPIAESTVDPLPIAQLDALLSAVQQAIAAALPRFAALIPPMPAPMVDMAPFTAGVAQMSAETQAALQQAQRPLAELVEVLSAIRETTDSLSILQDGANQVVALAEMRNRLNAILGEPPSGLRAVQEMSVEPLVSAIDGLRSDMGRFVDKVQAGQKADERRLKGVQALDRFLVAVEGK